LSAIIKMELDMLAPFYVRCCFSYTTKFCDGFGTGEQIRNRQPGVWWSIWRQLYVFKKYIY